ncbi:MAG TPA: carboxypeptidase regulatory-like domain-containing protein, partial [Flavisolibacter sp.]
MKKFFSLTLVLLLAFGGVQAQGSIRGKIIDSASKAPLSLATVTVFKAADTALITYRISTPDGEFKVNGLPLNATCRVVISYSGYNVYRHVFTLTGSDVLDMGTIRMSASSGTLDEVLVIAERPPVSIRKDTIEFNASSFKTLPTALVEDMLKKLPGVQVDADGNITANGKRVNRILVDGKEFFGNDPKMATRNLPANIIDKIQLTEDKDERELNPDKPAGDIGQVINLRLKKAIKKGWFGKAYAGAGTNDRYEAGTILNLFRDTMQLSLIGFSNNLNRSGFGVGDIQSLGGFGRTGIN